MFERTEQTKLSLYVDLLIALVPVAIWAVFLFGGRAAVLMSLCGFFSLWLEVPVRVLKKKRKAELFSPSAFFTGILASFLIPVTAPLWITPLIALFSVLCRSFTLYFNHRVMNSAVFSVFVASLLFPGYMERYTKPFAYFPAFEIVPDAKLVDAYRVFSPLHLLDAGTYYEGGFLAQLIGVASGPIGAVAILCLVFSFVWLLLRKHASLYGTLAYLLTVALISAAFSPDDVEMVSYAGMQLLSGGVVFLSVFAMNDFSSVPNPSFRIARIVFGLLAGILTCVFRSFAWGLSGDYLSVLIVNASTPLLEKLSDPLFISDVKQKLRRKTQ